MASKDFKANLAQVSGGRSGLAPAVWMGTTIDNLATITASGYVSDLVEEGLLKGGDWLFISHSATSGFPVSPPSGIFVVGQILAVFSLILKVDNAP